MIMLTFIRTQFGFLLFGFLLMGLSNFGQTYFIALYRLEIQADFGITDGSFAALYSAMTLLSSLVLLYSGQFIDRWALTRVVAIVVGALTLACLLMGLTQTILALGVALFMLRHFGQGLCTHTAITATGRAYSAHRGRALAAVGLGYAVAESFFPLMAAALLAIASWQQSWLLFAAALVVILPIATRLARFEPPPEQDSTPQDDTAHIIHATRRDVLRDARFYLAVPLYVSAPFLLTGMFLNNALLADERGWSLTLLATGFTVYAVLKIALLPVSGYLIDRFTAARVFPFTALPLLLAFAVLVAPDTLFGIFTPFIYLGLCGVHVQLMSTAAGGLWPELFGTKHLGAIRSMTTMTSIFATAAAPLIFAYALEIVNFRMLAVGGMLYVLVAGGLAFIMAHATLTTHEETTQ